MKKILVFATTAMMVMAFIFSGFTLPIDQNQTERFGWKLEGFSWSIDSFAYSNRETVSEAETGESFPALFLDNLNQGSSCGPATATNIVQYYDGIYPELVPGVDPFLPDSHEYTKTSLKAEQVADELYTLMKTNQNGSGTTVGNYKAGLQTYVESKGLHITYASSMSSGKLNLSNYISCINQKKPVSIVVNNIQYIEDINFTHKSGQAKLSIQVIQPSHILIGYGYVKYNYYRMETHSVWSPVWYNPFRFIDVTEEVLFRTDEYLKVSFGNGTLGYMNLNNSTISDSFTSHITR